MPRVRVPAKSKSPVLGIDVSNFQGRIDWDRVAAARVHNPVTGKSEPIRFAYIRASGSTYVDASFTRNWRECKRVGIRRGPYVAMTAAAYQHTATAFYAQLAEAIAAGGGWGFGDLPPMLDHEKGQAPDPTLAQWAANVRVVQALREEIRDRMGRRAGVYAGGYWTGLADQLPPDLRFALSDAPLWCPDYGRVSLPWDCEVPDEWAPERGGHWYIRQYDSRGEVAGISGNVDMNLYDGGRLAIAAFAARSAVAGARGLLYGFGLGLVVFLLLMLAGYRPSVLMLVPGVP